MENNRLVLFGCAHELCQMCFKMKKRRLVYFTVAAFALVCAGQIFGPASVITGQSDYPPGSTVQISGAGFTPGETVQLQVVNLTNPTDTGDEHAPWLVTNGASGNFTTTWYVACEILNVNIKLAKKT
jgi:hypothetical protein